MNAFKLIILGLMSSLMICCKSENRESKQASDQRQEWISLFDGKTTDGWRAFNSDKLPPQWVIKKGELTFDSELRLEKDKAGGNDIIYGLKQFDNFELYLEWKLPKGGNSGVFYHLIEGDYAPYEVAPEYQLLDDDGWEEMNNAKLEEWQKAGADYAMYTPDLTKKKLNPSGEWNTTRIVFTSEQVEYWLNGNKILSFVPWSDDWHKRKSEGKWKDFPKYGTSKSGYIGLQDHDSPLWFREIKIKRL